jgi:hypothetical protein
MPGVVEPVGVEPNGAWSSALSVSSFASMLDLGMEPIGVTRGVAVMQWAWYAGNWGRPPLPAPTGRKQYSETWQCPHGFVGAEHRMYGFNYEQTWVEGNWANGFGLAYRRMLDEATALGAHGIVGVVDEMRQPAGAGTAEFSIRGTAVRVPGAARPSTPFATYLSGQRLAKLIEAGYVPVGIAAALSSVQMIGSCMTHYQLAGTTGMSWGASGVQSITQVTRAQSAARHLAREHIRSQLATDALHGATFEQFEHELGEADMAVQCVMKGTRVRRISPFAELPEPDLVVPLS